MGNDPAADGVVAVPVTRYGKTGRADPSDWLTVEAPLQILVNRRPFTVTMRTPGQDEALARGLLFTEGVVPGRGRGYEATREDCSLGIAARSIDLTVPESELVWQSHERSMMSASSCGLCGKTHLEDIETDGPSVSEDGALTVDRIFTMQDRMRAEQASFARSGGTHAAAAFALDGALLAVHEDIGRHNAVDKVIGTLIEEDLLDRAGAMTVSGRVSFEIVTKAAAADIRFLIAVSAPSSLAVDLARMRGMTVVGFCRDDRLTVYCHGRRVVGEAHRGR